MPGKRATTIPGYIDAAPAAGQAHLRRLYAILKSVAPKAEEAIKWDNPFFIEPRFLFAFSAHKAHLSFSPSAQALQHFRAELVGHDTTRHFLKVRYDQPLPEALIRKIAKFQLGSLRGRKDDGFW